MNHTLYIPALKEYLDVYIPKRKLLTKQQALALESKKQQQPYTYKYRNYLHKKY